MIYAVFHKKDFDGRCSYEIFRRAVKEEHIYVPYNYDEELILRGIQEGDSIYFMDVTPKHLEDLLSLAALYKVYLIDHHISVIEYLKGKEHLFHHIFTDTNRAACQLVWDNFYPGIERPEFVDLLGDFDIWKKEDADKWSNRILPLQLGLRIGRNSLQRLFDEPLFLNEAIEKGLKIQEYIDQEAFSICKNAFEKDFEGLRAICVNAPSGNSLLFKSVWNPEKHDVMVKFHKTNKLEWTYSIYTEKEIDLTPIAIKYGGGGHKKACGFTLKELIV